MKKVILFIAILFAINLNAQNLESKIPKDASVVVAINGDQIFDLISQSDIEGLDIFKSGPKLDDFGVDMESKAYYFFEHNEDVMFNTFLIKIRDRQQLESFVAKNNIEVKTIGNQQSFNKDQMMAVWDNNTLLISLVAFTSNTPGPTYAPTPEVMDGYNYEEDVEVEIEEEVMEVDEPQIEEAIDEPEFKSADQIVEIEDYYEYQNPYDDKYFERLEAERIANEIKAIGELTTHTAHLLKGNVTNSILTNKSYMSGKSNKSSAYLWLGNYGELMNSFMKPSMSGMAGMMGGFGTPDYSGFGFEALKANLFFDKDQIRLSTAMYVSDAHKNTYKKLYKGGLSKNFYKYLNHNNMLAYMSLSLDTETFLNEYPSLASDMYGSMLPQYKEETSVGLDLLSVILDEEAIGELITGDALFVLNNLSEKEVEYTSYEYDENFEPIPVTKTKMDIVPNFTIMMGSENKKIINKLLNLSTKYRLAENKNSFFHIKKMAKLPFDLYLTMKDDILFMTNSEMEMTNIVTNKFVSSLGKHKSFLKKNVSTFYFNTEAIINQLPESYKPSSFKDKINYVKDNMSEFYFVTSKFKKNKIQTDLVLKTSAKQPNSLKFMLDLIQKFTARPNRSM